MLSKHAKLTGRRDFELDNQYRITCWTYETRYSWGHYAELYQNGSRIDDTKYTYYNRTWESYTYQSILHGLIDKAGLPETYKKIADVLGAGNTKEELGKLRAVAVMANLIGTPDTTIDTLVTVTGGAISKPEDWDTLSETEKKDRIDKAIEVLS